MKMKIIFLAMMFMIFSGCMNLYVRCPFTNEKIEKTYQCTQETFAFTYVVMFPQVMNPTGSHGFYAENLVTVPIGCCFFVDVACEGVIDTICWPADYFIAKKRHEKVSD